MKRSLTPIYRPLPLCVIRAQDATSVNAQPTPEHVATDPRLDPNSYTVPFIQAVSQPYLFLRAHLPPGFEKSRASILDHLEVNP